MVWRDIPGTEKYEVSDTGIVRNKRTGRILKQHLSTGYYRVSLIFGLKMTIKTVHSLVALAFLGERPIDDLGNPYFVNHIDGNKKNNDLSNLEYTSSWDNTRHYHLFLKHGVTPNRPAREMIDEKDDELWNKESK